MALCLLLLTVSTFAVDPHSNGTPPDPPAGPASAPPGGGGEGFDFEFSGVYTWGEVITSLCREGWCRTQLPKEFYNLSVPLSVYEHNFNDAFKALSMQAKADGYRLTKTGKKKPFVVSAELDVDRSATYISCLDTAVHSVPSVDLYRYVRADSIRCAARDGIVPVSDSSLSVVRYRVNFYVVSSTFLQTIGVDWTSIWASGDLTSMPKFITDWTLRAVSSDDSTAEFRSIEVDLDSSTTLHWGSQKKEEKSTVVYSNGVAQNDYEWKDYGLTLSLMRVPSGIRAEYQLAQRDENNSILSGSFGGSGSYNITTFGVYDSYQHIVTGIPFLRSIPVIGLLFGRDGIDKIKSFFVIECQRLSPLPVDSLPDKPVQDFPMLDSLMLEKVGKYERILEDTTSAQVDSTDQEAP